MILKLNTIFSNANIYNLSIVFLLHVLLFGSNETKAAYTQAERSKYGMVVTSEPISAEIGSNILKEGGNSIDAAVAVGFAMAVTYPYAGNIGGGGFLLYDRNNGESNKSEKPVVIDFREVAPILAKKDMFLNEDGSNNPVRSTKTHLSVGVPGTVAGLCKARELYGTMPLSKLLAPAIKLAEEGFIVSYNMANLFKIAESDFKKNKSSAKIFIKQDGSLYKEGDLLVQKDLANTLKLISKNGSDGFYKGKVAELIADDMKKNNGIISLEDLSSYQTIIREPLIGKYRDYDIITIPPPSSGVHLVQALNLLEPYNISLFGHNSAKSIHLMVESLKRIYADRAEYLGDPNYSNIPINWLMSKQYANTLRSSFNLYKSTPSANIKHGSLENTAVSNSANSYVIPSYVEAEKTKNTSIENKEVIDNNGHFYYKNDLDSQTTHISITDSFGSAVSMTYTLNLEFGSRIVAEGTGIILNNEMDDFSAKPGVPNAYGLIGSSANAIEPKKRPLSSMMPAIVKKNNQILLVTGSPGGSRIISTVLQIVLNTIEHKMDVSEAVCAPRIHHQLLPEDLWLEPQVSEDTKSILGTMGYSIIQRRPWGGANSILWDETHKLWLGAPDPRTRGKASPVIK